MNIITKSLFILYLIITHHLLYANIHIARANTYLEWIGMASYPNQNIAIPLVWAIPSPKLLGVTRVCDGEAMKIEPDKDILNRHMKDIDIGLEVDILDQLCSVNSNFCINRKQEKENKPKIIDWILVTTVIAAIALTASAGVNVLRIVNSVDNRAIEKLYENDRTNLMSKINHVNIKLEELEKSIEKTKENLCNITSEVLSGSLANQYLSTYWNKYKSVLDSAIRGKIHHQLINLEELGKLVMDRGLKYGYNELDMFSMFRASKFILTKHSPATPSIHGILLVPVILKTETLPVYRPLTLTTANTRYYKFPNEVAISYVKNYYHVYQLEGCDIINDRYICPVNAAKTSDKTREIEDFMNDIDNSITSDIAEYDRDCVEGMNGIYIKKGQEHVLIKLSDNINERIKKNENSFINYEEFDIITIGERKIIGSSRITKSLKTANSDNDPLSKAYTELRHAKELLLKNNLLTDEKVPYTPSSNTIWAYLISNIDTYKYVAISGYVTILIIMFWTVYIEYRIRVKH